MKIFIAYILDTTKDLFKKFKKLIVVLLAFMTITGGIVGGDLAFETDQEKIDALPAEQLLKATPDKIVESEDEIKVDCLEYSTKGSSTCIRTATTTLTKYSYISDTEIKAEKYEDYNEDINKRSSNVQYFEKGNEGKALVYIYDKFGGSGNKYLLGEDTITKEAFELQKEKVSLLDFFIGNANADTSTSSTNNGDAHIISYASLVNTNYSTDEIVGVYSYATNNYNHGLWSWTLPAGSGTISDVKMYLYKISGTTNRTLNLHEILRADTNISQATFNSYKTGSTWTTAGAVGDGTDYSSTVIDTTNENVAYPNWISLGVMGATADNPLTLDWGDSLILMLKPASYANDSTVCQYRSKEYATSSLRSYLEITYTAGGGESAAPTPNNDIIIFE